MYVVKNMLCVNLLLKILFLSFLCVSLSNAFGFSPPLTPVVCASLAPFGHWNFASNSSENLDFQISSSREWFMPNESITITVSSPSEKTFKGIILQVRNQQMYPSGTISFTSKDFQHLHCEYVLPGMSYNSTVVHHGSKKKSVAFFTWVAPPFCKDQYYEVGATIVKSSVPNSYQTGLRKLLECRSSTVALSSGRELALSSGTRNRQCRYSQLTSVPNQKYVTSFETDNLNGWNNRGWTINSGSTSTINTGPTEAAEGEKYLYFESSLSPSYHPSASLETDRDLRGCFCIKLQHHHNVDSKRNHKLQITAGNEILYQISDKQSYWNNVSVQVDINVFVKVKIRGYRGDNFRGDMAVDDIRITAGLCLNEGR